VSEAFQAGARIAWAVDTGDALGTISRIRATALLVAVHGHGDLDMAIQIQPRVVEDIFWAVSEVGVAAPIFSVGRYLVYLINWEPENGSLKNIDLLDQKTAL